jgi:hypothetical protein
MILIRNVKKYKKKIIYIMKDIKFIYYKEKNIHIILNIKLLQNINIYKKYVCISNINIHLIL